MSRITAIWTAGAVALLFALVLGAVLLRPVLGVNADAQNGSSQTEITTLSQDGTTPSSDSPQWRDDDDDDDHGWDDDDHEDHDERDGEHEDDD
ncbi:MAG: hypothetical protein R3A46_10950 [Thermomicrobiales bacterium]